MKVEIKKKEEIKVPAHCLSIARGSDENLYAACVDGGVYSLDKKGNKNEITRHDNFVSGVNVSNGSIVSADYDGIIKWTSIDSGKEQRKIIAHKFWSWQTKISRDNKMIGSVTGQYLVGGYKYEPSEETEPSVKVYDASSGELIHKFSHVPPVQSLAFSNDSRYLAAGNLMGEVRVWDLNSGKIHTTWNTPSFTGWGIIKGHYYTGGVFSMEFSPDDSSIYLAGMGSTRDPAAGNGKQLWEEFSWKDQAMPPTRKRSALDGEIGPGLIELEAGVETELDLLGMMESDSSNEEVWMTFNSDGTGHEVYISEEYYGEVEETEDFSWTSHGSDSLTLFHVYEDDYGYTQYDTMGIYYYFIVHSSSILRMRL